MNEMFNFPQQLSEAIDVHFFGKGESADVLGENIVSLNQVHGNNVVIVQSPSWREKEADAALTDQLDLTLTIRIADCQAFVVYAPNQHVIGVIHAGWKGLVNGVIPSTLNKMKDEWNIDLSTVLVGSGPSLCMECAEFTDPREELPGIDPQFFHGRHADLRSIADDQLMQCGVLREHIERHPDCTKCRPDLYYSYRGGDKDKVIQGCANTLAVKLKIDN